MFKNPSNDEIRNILTSAKTIAVVGLSENPERVSYSVSEEMQRRGYRIIPVNPNVTEVLGEKSYASVTEIPDPVDIINIFRRSEALPEIVREAVLTSAPVIWAQLGVYNEEASDMAKAANKVMVMDSCIKVMHSLTVR